MAPHQAIATLAVVRHVMQRYPKTAQLLDADVACDGVYMPTVGEPEHCNALAATLWECVALAQHWHPSVGKAARELLGGRATLLQRDVTLQALRELVHSLDTLARATFAPPVQPPPAASLKRSSGAHALLARTGNFNARQPPRRTPPPRVPSFAEPGAAPPSSSSSSSLGESLRRQFANAKLRALAARQRSLLAAWKRQKKS